MLFNVSWAQGDVCCSERPHRVEPQALEKEHAGKTPKQVLVGELLQVDSPTRNDDCR